MTTPHHSAQDGLREREGMSSATKVRPTDTTGIEEAWAEVEALLPEGWHMAVINRQFKPGNSGRLAGWRASANDGQYLEQVNNAPTPAAALRGLAEKFRMAVPFLNENDDPFR